MPSKVTPLLLCACTCWLLSTCTVVDVDLGGGRMAQDAGHDAADEPVEAGAKPPPSRDHHDEPTERRRLAAPHQD